jgi:hypothetical protein
MGVEVRHERPHLIRGELLASQEDHSMVKRRMPEGAQGVGIEWLAQADPARDCSQRRRRQQVRHRRRRSH